MQRASAATTTEQQYGSVPAAYATTSPATPLTIAKKRMSWVATGVALLVPWLTFTIVFGLLSFSMRYKHADLCWYIIALLGFMIMVCGVMAYKAHKKRQAGDPTREPTWYIFVFLTLVFAWVFGLILGAINYAGHMEPYYDVTNLNTYPAVDPSRMTGQQVMDAGRVVFTRGSYVDVSRSMGFKDSIVYCVAPILLKGSENISTYDFWAVGNNCCSGDAPDFHCNQFNSPSAHAGLRLMGEGLAKYYNLAVEQARVAYKINARHPLFFTWMEDPISEVNMKQDAGLKFYLLGVLSFFAFQLFTVVMVSIGFSKLS